MYGGTELVWCQEEGTVFSRLGEDPSYSRAAKSLLVQFRGCSDIFIAPLFDAKKLEALPNVNRPYRTPHPNGQAAS